MHYATYLCIYLSVYGVCYTQECNYDVSRMEHYIATCIIQTQNTPGDLEEPCTPLNATRACESINSAMKSVQSSMDTWGLCDTLCGHIL